MMEGWKMKIRRWRILTFITLCHLLLFSTGTANSSSADTDRAGSFQADLAWVEYDRGNYQIYYSRFWLFPGTACVNLESVQRQVFAKD
jgi:hypothetical protein